MPATAACRPELYTCDEANYFNANDMCIRTVGGKWISGKSWNGGGRYGWVDAAPPASSYGITH